MRGNRATLRFVDRFLACESRHDALSFSSLAFGASPQYLRYPIGQQESKLFPYWRNGLRRLSEGDGLSWLPPSSSGKVIEFFGGLEENFGINLGQVVLSNAYIML